MTEVLKIRALIVDDERAARLKIRTLLADHPDVEVVRECSNGYEALEAVAELEPDLMFLDEVMPEIDGFAVLEKLDEAARPLVIFVTAHDEYAVKSYEVDSIDYLMKFPDKERFDKALCKVRERLAARGEDGAPAPKSDSGYCEVIYLPDEGGHIFVIHTDEIERIAAYEHYVIIHGARKLPPLREKISTLEAKLDPRVFVCIHRSHIVRIKLIAEMNYDSRHKSWVTLRDGTKVRLSRTGYEKLLARGLKSA